MNSIQSLRADQIMHEVAEKFAVRNIIRDETVLNISTDNYDIYMSPLHVYGLFGFRQTASDMLYLKANTLYKEGMITVEARVIEELEKHTINKALDLHGDDNKKALSMLEEYLRPLESYESLNGFEGGQEIPLHPTIIANTIQMEIPAKYKTGIPAEVLLRN